MVHKSKTYTYERKHEIQTEEMSANKFATSISHSCMPGATNFDFCLIAKKVHGYTEVKWPGQV
jgi:hypothetical protein